MIKQLAHLCIHVTDLEQTKHFYHTVLGLPIQFTFIENDKPSGFYISLGNNTFIEVFQSQDNIPLGRITHMSLEVTDMDAIIALLQSHHIEVTPKILGADHAYQAWTTDPDGNRIEFHQYTPKALQLTGGICLVP
ncbi:VOC family protein [Poriferisphaera sp. WC338]|uniref:VOC family protein n=1 Tax=Poriferisphaera sp. WC338 TaxID=3425129 RepID=UPI003D814D44